MDTYLRQAIKVPFESLYLDPNNPRLAMDDPPGYEDVAKIRDSKVQDQLEQKVHDVYDVRALELAVESQGWMPIDNIVVWTYPSDTKHHIVVEGNTRTVALRNLRKKLPREEEKLTRMTDGRKRVAPHDIAEQKALVEQLQRVVEDTKQLLVVPLDADNIAELNRKLPRVLAVRHITGVKDWGNYAQDHWLLSRYEGLFEEENPGKALVWDSALVNRVAREASLGNTKAKRQLLAASCYSHFKSEFEDKLPPGEEFKSSDYYLFENIVKRPWLRQQFDFSDSDIRIPSEKEQVIFDWVFKEPSHGTDADQNTNVLYRHENVNLWDQMQKYDQQHKTSFASRLNPEEPELAPRMREVEAEYTAHKASQKPSALLEQLLTHLGRLDTDTLVSEGRSLQLLVERLHEMSSKILRMIKAIDA